jgi:hypothetical protein
MGLRKMSKSIFFFFTLNFNPTNPTIVQNLILARAEELNGVEN